MNQRQSHAQNKQVPVVTGAVTSNRILHDYSNNNRLRFNLLNFKEMCDKFQTCHGGKQLDCSSFHGKTIGLWRVGDCTTV